MVNFLNVNNKQFGLKLVDNCVFGRVGFSFTEKSITTLIHSLYSYLTENSYKTLYLMCDHSTWSAQFIDVILNELSALSFPVKLVNKPSTIFQLPWLLKQANTKSFGLYLGKDCHSELNLGVHFFLESGKVATEKDLKHILKHSCNLRIKDDYELLRKEDIFEEIDIDLYPKYLTDKKLIPVPSIRETVNIDTMFGASENLFNLLKTHINLDLVLFNLASQPPRLLNYNAKPVGKFLKWYTTYHTVKPNHYFFGIDGDGDSLGVYDIAQDIELSPSGVTILLLKYLKEIKGIESGTVVLSKALSDRVPIYAKKLGFKVVWSNNGISDLSNTKGAVLYADETGGYYLLDEVLYRNPVIAMLSIVDLCQRLKSSPGAILDQISKIIFNFYEAFRTI